MYNKNPYIILGIDNNATISEIKKAYKKIALENHPDKHHFSKDKDKHAEKFREASEAYSFLINNNSENNEYWKSMWDDIKHDYNNENSFFKNLAKIFVNSEYINKNNKNIFKYTNLPITHNISVNVSYNEIYNNLEKKLRLILKHINEPIYIKIKCKDAFPITNKIYIDDEDIEHQITIKINLKKFKNFKHIITDNKIDFITTIDLNLLDIINGYNTKIMYIDNTERYIYIPPFTYNKYEIKNLGINNGSLILNINYIKLTEQYYNKLNDNDKHKFLELLYKIFK
jgi:DnaJ-class molecular chaperone